MSRSYKEDIRKQKKNRYIAKWCEWRIEVFGKIKYKDLIKQIEFYEKN